MEALLHFAWQHRLWDSLEPVASLEGCDIEIIDVGFCNHHAGPDFFEAKVRIDDIVWIGAVEIHRTASEWLQHEHHLDPAYAGVILHVVEEADCSVLGCNARPLPTLVMRISSSLRERADYFVRHATHLPCSPLSERLSPLMIQSHLEAMSRERLEQKADAIEALAQQYDWYEALYITVMRYFGFDLNNDAMERLARLLPYKLLIRYLSHPKQFEAMLLGQANCLMTLPYDEYRAELEREYAFLSVKHQLPAPLPQGTFRQARTRPQSFPLRRLLQAASIISKPSFTPTALAEIRTLEAFRDFFKPNALSPYWQTYYDDVRGRSDSLQIGRTTLHSLIINIALPLRYAMRRQSKARSNSVETYAILGASPTGGGAVGGESGGLRDGIAPYLGQVELDWLRSLAPESNQITRRFERAGVRLRSAADSQAVIQIYKRCCLQRKCLYCPWGHRLLALARE